MEILLVLAVTTLLIVILINGSSRRSALRNMEDSILTLSREIRELRNELKDERLKNQNAWAPREERPLQPPPAAAPKPQEPRPVPPPASPPLRPPAPIITPSAVSDTAPPMAPSDIPPMSLSEDTEGWMGRWMRRNPDLEKFIGENLINKIGIAVLVLGIAFFVKYAIDKDWIGEAGRVAIGLGCGALLAGIAHYLRNSYRAFSSVLAGGGIVVFYFTIAFAFQQYHLISQVAAFIIMVVITGLAVALSLLYDKLELAVIAIVGGFLTPFLLSTGEGNYIVLFTYLLILNVGMLLLAWFKRWKLLNILSLLFTVVIFGAWLTAALHGGVRYSPPLAILFATGFYLIFLGMNMIHQLRRAERFRAFDFSILLAITALYYASGMLLAYEWHGTRYQGVLTLSMGVLNLGLAWYLFRRAGTDRNLLYLLIGLTLSFLTLTVPVQLHGHTITLFWSAEIVLLFWLYQRSGIALFRYSALLIAGCTLISLLMDWGNAQLLSTGSLPIIFINAQGIITNMVAIAAFGGWAWLMRREGEGKDYIVGIGYRSFQSVAIGTALVLLYLTAIFSVNLAFVNSTSFALPGVYHRLITFSVVLAFIMKYKRKSSSTVSWLQVAAIILCFIYYLGNSFLIAQMRNGYIDGRRSIAHLLFHWAGILVLLYCMWATIQLVRTSVSIFEDSFKWLTWLFSIMLVILVSNEIAHLFVLLSARNNMHAAVLVHHYNKAVLTIVWGLCSFVLMWLGMRHKNKTMRIISLTIFSVALLKLVVIDLRGLTAGGRIAAFIMLGVLLLVVSFMYQKLKRLIIDEKTNE